MVNKTEQHIEDYIFTQTIFEQSVIKIVEKIKESKKQYKNIYPIPRGGLILGVYLSHELKLPLITDNITENTLVVDDICDTGSTLKQFADNDKAVLVTKSKGLSITNNLIFNITVSNNTWVHFPWENTKNKNKTERQAKLNDYI
jgi:hypothetical protein